MKAKHITSEGSALLLMWYHASSPQDFYPSETHRGPNPGWELLVPMTSGKKRNGSGDLLKFPNFHLLETPPGRLGELTFTKRYSLHIINPLSLLWIFLVLRGKRNDLKKYKNTNFHIKTRIEGKAFRQSTDDAD